MHSGAKAGFFMAIINSAKNFRVLQWAKLKQKAQRDIQRRFIVEGYHGVAEALKAGCLEEVVSLEKAPPFPGKEVPHFHVTYEVMEKLTAMATPAKMLGICRWPDARGVGDSVLVVDEVHHPGNLGTILRSCVAFGVDTVCLNAGVDIFHPKVVQASQGMIFHVSVLRRGAVELVGELKEKGYQIIGTDVREGVALGELATAKKRVVILGNEGEGVGAALLALCDTRVNIPMDARCESLNVGVAAGIILYGLCYNAEKCDGGR